MDAIKRAIKAAGSASQLARDVGVTRQAVHQWSIGGRVSPENAVKIENACNRAVLREELRPDIFRRL